MNRLPTQLAATCDGQALGRNFSRSELLGMIPKTVEQLLEIETEDAAEQMMDDEASVFVVDWREMDDAIVEYCEDILQTGDLEAEVNDIDDDPGIEMFISHGGQRVQVPLKVGDEDRHITLYTLNELLKPAYEIRVCVASLGSDTLVFLPLPAADWKDLEERHGEKVAKHFLPIQQRPNLFTGK